jgi:hypothetical protein
MMSIAGDNEACGRAQMARNTEVRLAGDVGARATAPREAHPAYSIARQRQRSRNATGCLEFGEVAAMRVARRVFVKLVSGRRALAGRKRCFGAFVRNGDGRWR